MTAVLGLIALALAQEPPVFRAHVESVYVDVFVTRKDAPVAGLGADEFQVKDNGVTQRVEVVDRALVPTTTVLALDASWSVAGSKLVHLREAACAFLAGLAERDEAALVTFGQNLVLREDATRDRAMVGDALDRVGPGGGTALIDALYVCLKRRWGSGRPLWAVDSATGLPAAFLRILEAANARYVLRYEPTGVRRVGRHRLKVSVRRRGVEVRARREYVVPAAPPE
jgi:hypothetical protein